MISSSSKQSYILMEVMQTVNYSGWLAVSKIESFEVYPREYALIIARNLR
jgi:hypothetical protein